MSNCNTYKNIINRILNKILSIQHMIRLKLQVFFIPRIDQCQQNAVRTHECVTNDGNDIKKIYETISRNVVFGDFSTCVFDLF